jgi:HK97 gp10 family phage protein
VKFSMRVEGGEELARTLNALPEAVSRKVQLEALKKAAQPMRASMASHAPRGDQPPHIADNIGISVARRRADTEEGPSVVVGPVKGFAYGLPLEYGTRHTAAQPFMRPAFDTDAPSSLGIVGQELWAALEKRARRR